MRVGTVRHDRPMRILTLVAALAMLALAAVAIGGDSPARAQEADGAVGAPALSSDKPGAIVVSWEVPSPEPSDYRIDWAKPGEDYTSWTVNDGHVYPDGDETTVTIEGLEPGEEYKVRMRARYNKGDYEDDPWSGPWTADVLITVADKTRDDTGTRDDPTPTPTPTPTPAPLPSGTITGLAVSSLEAGSLTVLWQTPSPEPSDYRIDWAKSGEDYTSWEVNEGHAYPDGDETTVTIEGLEPGVEYKVRMRARYNKGDHADDPWSGPWTADMLVTVADPPLPPPVIVDVIEPEDLVTAQQSDVGTLYSNLEQDTESDVLHVGHRTEPRDTPDLAIAIPFTTGPNPAGYNLQGVTVNIIAVIGPSGGTFEGTLKPRSMTTPAARPGRSSTAWVRHPARWWGKLPSPRPLPTRWTRTRPTGWWWSWTNRPRDPWSPCKPRRARRRIRAAGPAGLTTTSLDAQPRQGPGLTLALAFTSNSRSWASRIPQRCSATSGRTVTPTSG